MLPKVLDEDITHLAIFIKDSLEFIKFILSSEFEATFRRSYDIHLINFLNQLLEHFCEIGSFKRPSSVTQLKLQEMIEQK